MKLYCMRHGETDYNRLGLCNDDPAVDVRLTETGIRQAEQTAAALKDRAISRIITSELPRTRQTADIVNRYHDAPVMAHPALNDIRTGFESRPVADYFAAIESDRLHLRINGGESLLDYKARVLTFLDWLDEQPRQDTLVVAHEETLRVIKAHLDGLGDEAMPRLHFANCEVVEFDLGD
jgi:broad specificity phosphatase PhoE